MCFWLGIASARRRLSREYEALSFRVTGKMMNLDDGERDEIGCVEDVEPCDVTARELLNAEGPGASGGRERPPAKVDLLATCIREYLADGEWHPSIRPELEAQGFASGTIHDACRRIARVRKAPGSMSGGWEWRLHSSETPDSSTDHEHSAPAPRVSVEADSSTDRGKKPITTEQSKSQTSSTKRNGIDASDSRRVEESDQKQDLPRARERDRTIADLADGEVIAIFPGAQPIALDEPLPAGTATWSFPARPGDDPSDNEIVHECVSPMHRRQGHDWTAPNGRVVCGLCHPPMRAAA